VNKPENISPGSGTIAALAAAHRPGAISPAATVAHCYQRIRDRGDEAIFIALREEADALAQAEALAQSGDREGSLYGVPVAVKDNIDVQGLPTTAACPVFAYDPAVDATCVARLKAAGAVVVGKTNLDQFATGLVGVRTPYGIPRNALNPALIPGGSSAGSAVAVAAGLLPLALGTDTAGSGRVPAALNNIVGLKPSLGLISTAGVVPACRTIDCVSVLALTVDDAFAALTVLAGIDVADPYSRARPLGCIGLMPNAVRLGVPRAAQRPFFGDDGFAAAYHEALARCARLGARIIEIDFEPFYRAARLLYEGPWVTERYLAAQSVIASAPEAMHPVTREIILGGSRASAADAFVAFYELEQLRSHCGQVFREIDALALPTVPTAYTIDEVVANPVELNSRLGTYTNFANLLDLCALAVPASIRAGGTPFGITFMAPAGQDAALASIVRVFHADTGLPLGATGQPQPPLAPLLNVANTGEVAVAVVGAHLSGMPLNRELRSLGARLLQTTRTAPHYRLFALSDSVSAKPGLLRVAPGSGAAIEAEIWAMPCGQFGSFIAEVSAPLSIGTVVLQDGRSVKGFLVEAQATVGARDISQFGGWRAFMQQVRATA
jgi:allophanate hydrolase